jgi:GGDEF domain-containing protein
MTPEQLRIAELEALVAQLTHDASYGCLSRAGFELAWQPGGAIVFGDIDHMHRLNNDYGYTTVNEMIRDALAALKTRDDTIVAGRWFSGDELVWSVPAGDAAGFVARIRATFTDHGLSITLGIAAAEDDLSEVVGRAAEQVQAQKRAR